MEFLGSWFNASVASSSVSSNLRGTDALPSESTVVGNGNRLTSLENQFRLPVEWGVEEHEYGYPTGDTTIIPYTTASPRSRHSPPYL